MRYDEVRIKEFETFPYLIHYRVIDNLINNSIYLPFIKRWKFEFILKLAN